MLITKLYQGYLRPEQVYLIRRLLFDLWVICTIRDVFNPVGVVDGAYEGSLKRRRLPEIAILRETLRVTVTVQMIPVGRDVVI